MAVWPTHEARHGLPFCRPHADFLGALGQQALRSSFMNEGSDVIFFGGFSSESLLKMRKVQLPAPL